jgi:hypothetical protein
MTSKNILYLTIASVIALSCNNGPKVIEGQTTTTSDNASGIFSENSDTQEDKTTKNGGFTEDLHTVVINEVLPASRYVYLKVIEGGEQFWIATSKKEIKVGDTYFYKGGLLKTNFESKEHNRVFDKIYLVTNLVPKDHGDKTGSLADAATKTEETQVGKTTIPTHTSEVIEHKGSVKIADIVANPKKFEGKTVQISGKCVKINPGIMNRNWIHLQDGSKDNYDLVLTSDTFVAEGTIVTMRAMVALNRDYGAGYKYDLILEDGTLIE